MSQHQVLRIAAVNKSFGDKQILRDVSFSINRGEIFGFVGLNGVGKTTLIKIILDLLDEDCGAVEIFGVDKILPKARKNLCYLPEKFHPANNLKGREFIKFVLELYHQKLNENKLKKICQALEFPFEMLQKRATQYSKGMTQKLGLMAIFLSKADLVILDEPMSGLDVKARINLKRQLLDYKNQGKTIFFSSHILSDMEEICDRIAVLSGGAISFVGQADEFKKKHGKESLDEAFLCEVS